MGEDRNAVAFADVEVVQGAGEPFHLRHGGREGERAVAIDPAQRHLVGATFGTIAEKLVHQHGIDLTKACR